MKIIRCSFLYVAALFCLSLIVSVISTAQPLSADKIITVLPSFSTSQVEQDGTVRASIRVTIANGWHINSHTPTFDYLIGTEITFQPNQKISVVDVHYPPGKKVLLGFAEQPIDLYEGTITLTASFKIMNDHEFRSDTVRGILTAQACNNQTCLAPVNLDIVIPLHAAAAKTDTLAATQRNETSAPTVPSVQGTQNRFANDVEKNGLLLTLFAIFLVGLALNLTPCVYPMLSVTVSLFGGQSETKVVRVFLKAVMYVLGMASMYSVLGVTAALGGGLFGSWLQSSWVLGGIAVLLFALALSSFGLYQIQMPYWLTSRLGGSTGTGFIATYLSGLVVGIFAAPCVGPPVLALLTFVAAKGDPWFGFFMFFTLSFGLGFPYLVLGTFSGLLKKIPRSGSWLVWVERIFGVVLTAAALFYLTLAVMPKLAFDVIPIALIAGGMYLGFIDRSGREKPLLKKIQWAVGSMAVGTGLWFALNLGEKGITWNTYTETALSQATENKQPVLIDFSADWCIPCKELDQTTWNDQQVIDATKKFMRLKVDLTRFDSPESEALRKKYHITGVPTVVLIRAEGREATELRSVGFFTAKEFLAKLCQNSLTEH
ncbi:MAG TPA: cytochrome c biogenesis protein CcdA [Bacteroidota bacterium]|nr:cytochrome c biogenesis protein CcdA [Bacteroidota bacterium]